MKGYKKIIAQKKCNGVMDVEEGKTKLSFTGYIELCRYMLRMRPDGRRNTFMEGIFGWNYQVLQWNLMCRSINVDKLMFQHIIWREDCLVFTLPVSKCDQTGESVSKEKHVFGNPIIPEICPILALSVLIFGKSRHGEFYRKTIMEGSNSQDRYSSILFQALNNIPSNIDLGGQRKDIGTHSNRKGSATFALSVCMVSAVAVYLRAGWSIGNTQDRYIFSGAGSDQIVGRAVCGLPIQSMDFAILPPHFSNEDVEMLTNSIGWDNILEHYHNYPAGFKKVIPYLLASIIYHYESGFLSRNLPSGHPLWNSNVFAAPVTFNGIIYENIVTLMQGKILLYRNFCPVTKMQATGIPEHFKIAEEVNSLKEKVDEIEQCRKRDHSQVLCTVDEMPSKLSKHILDNFQVNGAIPITQTILQDSLQEFSRNLMNNILPQMQSWNNNQDIEIPNIEGVEPSIFKYFNWGGRLMHIFPKDFHITNMPVKMIWNLWYFGNGALHIYPYKLVKERKQFYDLPGKRDKELYSKASKVVCYIEDMARNLGLLGQSNDISSFSRVESDSLFDIIFYDVVENLYPEGDYCDRIYDLTYTALYNRITKKV